MQRILIVTPDPNRLAGFSRALTEGQTLQLAWAHDGTAAVADVIKHPPLAVLIDDPLPDMPALDLVRRLLPINAMIHTAVFSDLSPEAFHEAAEGLGVLARLPLYPTDSDAVELLARLSRLQLNIT
jgi:DNA-binding NarL/FixJ family response regulator